MHQPPAVVWKLAGTRLQGGQLLVLGVLLVGVHGAWWLQAGTLGAAHLGAGAAVLAALLYAWHDWRRAPSGDIQWDGQVWSWVGPSGVAQPVVPVVTVDFQVLMLVRLHVHDSGRRWCWVGRAQDAASWLALRRALFAPGGSGAGDQRLRAKPPIPPIA